MIWIRKSAVWGSTDPQIRIRIRTKTIIQIRNTGIKKESSLEMSISYLDNYSTYLASHIPYLLSTNNLGRFLLAYKKKIYLINLGYRELTM